MSRVKPSLVMVAAALASLACVALAALWLPQLRERKGPTAVDSTGVPLDSVVPQITAVRDGVYMLAGAGGNIVVQAGGDGVLLVDTQYAALGPKNLAAVRSVTAAPIKYVINTHGHSDHVGGNAFFRGYDTAGEELRADADPQPAILAHENVVPDMQAGGFGAAWLPSELYSATTVVAFNGDRVALLHQPAAHTGGDTIVHFEKAGIIAAGDIYNGLGYPQIDRWKGGSTQGVLAGLDRLIELATPGGGRAETLVVPGHGAVAAPADVAAYRDMVATIVGRVERMIAAGMSLEQIQAARPTSDYDERYEPESGNWTPASFVAAIHHDLTK
jgi:glyoxylase-like metal-dependent hydrolase (beta-lactamase superfamily II)